MGRYQTPHPAGKCCFDAVSTPGRHGKSTRALETAARTYPGNARQNRKVGPAARPNVSSRSNAVPYLPACPAKQCGKHSHHSDSTRQFPATQLPGDFSSGCVANCFAIPARMNSTPTRNSLSEFVAAATLAISRSLGNLSSGRAPASATWTSELPSNPLVALPSWACASPTINPLNVRNAASRRRNRSKDKA